MKVITEVPRDVAGRASLAKTQRSGGITRVDVCPLNTGRTLDLLAANLNLEGSQGGGLANAGQASIGRVNVGVANAGRANVGRANVGPSVGRANVGPGSRSVAQAAVAALSANGPRLLITRFS